MKFVDLNTGELFNGSAPYIHWLSDGVSTDLVYSSKLCVLSNSKVVNIKLDSDIFKLMVIDSDQVQEYKNVCVSEYYSTGTQVDDNHYIHIIYISYHAVSPGEYHGNLLIGNEYVEIACDFYGENESLYINLANYGVELPNDIQKAIYECNIYEYKKDNILMNRKMKELLSNYWDVIANKGSYKSLINSLKWFEWGDLIKIREIWKHEDFGNITYNDRSLCSTMEDKYNDFYNEYSKTTYISLYVATQQLKYEYNDELNPIVLDLESLSKKWTKDELMLKLCLLGYFYEAYFMPIHLDLLHATLENIVFTNTIKLIGGTQLNREDYYINIHEFNCNVKDGDSFALSNVNVQVNNSTLFGTKWTDQTDYNEIHILGVDDTINKIKNNSELKTFYSQLYGGVGVVVNFNCELMTENDDTIQESILIINDKKIVDNSNLNHTPSFKVLFTEVGIYKIYIQFRSKGGNIYAKTMTINITDVSGMRLDIYTINPLSESDINILMTEGRGSLAEYKRLEPNSLFTRNNTGNRYSIDVPTSSSLKKMGIRLSHLLVLNGDFLNDSTLSKYYWMELRGKNSETGLKTICISKSFDFDPLLIRDFELNYKEYIYKMNYTYVQKFHYLSLLNSDNIEDYNVKNEAIMISAELPYGYKIDEPDWVFTNASTGKNWNVKDLQSPLVSCDCPLSNGYYDVEFRYKLGNEIKSIKRKSIFKI